MLFFVFFAAILNLSIGYALGSGFKLPEGLPKIPLPRKKKKLDDLDDEDALTRPVEENAEEKNEEESSAELPPTVTIALPKEETQETAVVEETPVEDAPTVANEEETKKEISTQDLMAGLSKLQIQLSEVGDELKSHEDNPEEFDQCASRLQEANHDYLEKAQGTIEQLDDLGNAGDASAKAAKEAVSEGCDKAEQSSLKIDTLMAGELDEASRKEILAQSAELVESVKESCNLSSPTATDSVAEADSSSSKECSIDELFEKIDLAVNEINEGESLFIAEARLDPPKEPISESSLLDGITADLEALIEDSITASQAFSSGGRRLVLLAGDSLEHACQRVEQVRQNFESTTYMANSVTAQATVTCAVSEISRGATRDEIEKQLITAVEEAEEIGANRTFHHDGAFATAISPLELPVEKRVVEI